MTPIITNLKGDATPYLISRPGRVIKNVVKTKKKIDRVILIQETCTCSFKKRLGVLSSDHFFPASTLRVNASTSRVSASTLRVNASTSRVNAFFFIQQRSMS